MFLTHRPKSSEIENFLRQSRELPLSYRPVGIAKNGSAGFRFDTASSVIGKGEAAFARAQRALKEGRQFELGWVELFPRGAPQRSGTVVAVVVHHMGWWWFNGYRVVYIVAVGES